MKSSYNMNLIFKSILFGLAFALVTSCTPKKNSPKDANVARTARDGIGLNGQNVGGDQSFLPRGGYQPQVGLITQDSDSLNRAVQAFVSSTLSPDTFGYVDPNDGILFQGMIDFNPANGSINFSNSKLLIEIYDENAKADIDPPYAFFANARSGFIRNTGEVELSFEDAYGSVAIRGQINQGQGQSIFEGQVFFQNTKSLDGNGLGSGTLGVFRIPTCSFFACP